MSSPAPSPASRQALWDAMLDAEYNVCLWTMLSDRYTRLDDRFMLAVVVASSTTSIGAWTIWNHVPWAWGIISAIGSVAALLRPHICKKDRMQRMARLVGTWKRIAVNYESLWMDDSSLKDPGLRKQFDKIKASVTKINETRLPVRQQDKNRAAIQMLKRRGLPIPKELTDGK